MSNPYRSTRQIEFRHTDMAGIAHFSTFVEFMEDVEHEFLRSRGLSVVQQYEGLGTISWPRVSLKCDFQGAVRFEDQLDVLLVVARLGEKSVTYGFTFSHQGRPVASGEITAVCCRMRDDGQIESLPIPPTLRQRLTA